MKNNSSRIKPNIDVLYDSLTIDPEDFNLLVECLKSREENLIELYDRNLKYKASTNRKELNKLQLVRSQHKALETEREQKEDEIVLKYQNLKIDDSSNKK